MKFTRRPYQRQITEFILRTPKCAVWAGMGLGKTSATLDALDAILVLEGGPVLVIAPLRVARSTWPDEIRKWDHLSHLRVSVVAGDQKARIRALVTPADIYTINYEQLPWLTHHFGDAWPFRIVVADESTRLKSFRLRQGAVRSAALGKVMPHVDRFIELTGTPSPNGLQDLWGQAWFLDAGQRLGRTFGAFHSRWFQSIQVGPEPHTVRLEPHKHSQAEITERMSDVAVSFDPADYFDLRDPIVNVIKVDLPDKAREMYEQMEDEMFLQLDADTEVEAFSAAAKTMKCLQLASGAIYTDERCTEWRAVHDEKIAALHSIVEEAAGASVLVAYHFRSDLARLQDAFPHARVLDAHPRTIADWNAGKIPVLLAHPQAAGHGLNLQDGGNILVMFSHWWDLEQYQQIVERIGPVRQAQAGYNRPTFIHHIVAADTIDEVVLQRRESKRSVQDLLLEAMRRRVPA